MYVNVEFLGNEPIENVITCMNYRMDKVIYFGYDETINEYRKITTAFLEKHCGVKEVKFVSVSRTNLSAVLEIMKDTINREKAEGDRLFIDITGGEELTLVAFGMLSKELGVPMHMYDVKKDKLIELENKGADSISKLAKESKISMNLDKFIEMQGGKINYKLRKGLKGDAEGLLADKVENLWNVSLKHEKYWNSFAAFIRSKFRPDENLKVREAVNEIHKALKENTASLTSSDKLREMLKDLQKAGALCNVRWDDGSYSFQYCSDSMMDCLWDGGSILELYTHRRMQEKYDHCMVGVHIDWDGVIHEVAGTDVLNEIDVLALKGNIPIFISCKSGNMSQSKTLTALYELETVARRFGGKYAKKILATTNPIGDVYEARAKELGIEVRDMTENRSGL